MKTVNDNLTNVDVCVNGCKAIMNMAKWNTYKIGVAGGIEVVVKAISTHISNTDVCYTGCDALCSVTLNNGKCT